MLCCVAKLLREWTFNVPSTSAIMFTAVVYLGQQLHMPKFKAKLQCLSRAKTYHGLCGSGKAVTVTTYMHLYIHLYIYIYVHIHIWQETGGGASQMAEEDIACHMEG